MPWLMFGLVAACTFTLIGWRKWGDLPPNAVTAVVIGANVTTTLASVLMLHVGFHGRLIALYQGNLQRVQFLSKLLRCGLCCLASAYEHHCLNIRDSLVALGTIGFSSHVLGISLCDFFGVFCTRRGGTGLDHPNRFLLSREYAYAYPSQSAVVFFVSCVGFECWGLLLAARITF